MVTAACGAGLATVLPRASRRLALAAGVRLVAFSVVEEAGAVGAASLAGSLSSLATCLAVVVRWRGAG